MAVEKDVYVVLSRTNTQVGRIIRFFTGNQLNHASICFDEDLKEFYSFGRLTKSPTLVGGFIVENPNRYLANHQDVRIKAFKMSLSPKDYKAVCQRFLDCKNHRSESLYNYFSALYSFFGKQLEVDNSYTCFEFVMYVLGLKGIYSLVDFERINGEKLIYDGSYRNYLGINTRDIVDCDQNYETKRTNSTAYG
jgi:hypothetical protein